MTDASGIGYVTQSLQAVLRAAITDSGPLPGTLIDLRSPKEIASGGMNPTCVSLWLYRVTRNHDLVNTPPPPRTDGRIPLIPLVLDLHYLVTPVAPDVLTRQRLLGLAMQALHDQARIGAEFLPAELLDAPPGALGVYLEPQTVEEGTRIWNALHEPYDLSVTYLAQFVPIDSARSRPAGPPVLARANETAQIERVT